MAAFEEFAHARVYDEVNRALLIIGLKNRRLENMPPVLRVMDLPVQIYLLKHIEAVKKYVLTNEKYGKDTKKLREKLGGFNFDVVRARAFAHEAVAKAEAVRLLNQVTSGDFSLIGLTPQEVVEIMLLYNASKLTGSDDQALWISDSLQAELKLISSDEAKRLIGDRIKWIARRHLPQGLSTPPSTLLSTEGVVKYFAKVL